MVHLCILRREMNDSMHVKRNSHLLPNHCKTETEFGLATLSPTSAATRSSVGMPPLVQAQQWFGVALAPTVWGGRVKYGQTP